MSARKGLARLLWDRNGARRVPGLAALDRALNALPLNELFFLSELSPMGPVYLFPTRAFLRALAKEIRALGAKRILEVAAGDGHLARSLAREAPELEVFASDSGAWEKPAGRMNAKEKREHRRASLGGIHLGGDVLRLDATRAIAQLKPDLVLASWVPPGPLLAKLIRSEVKHVLEIGAGSAITGDITCWRFEHDFLEGKVESLARCRLDERPAKKLHTRVTLYFGKAHPEFHEERLTRDHPLRKMI